MSKPMLTERQCAYVMQALGDDARLKILESLLAQEKCVSNLVEEIGKQQAIELGCCRISFPVELPVARRSS